MSFYPIMFPMFIGNGGGLGWKVTLIFITLMSGMIGIIGNLMISMLFDTSLNPIGFVLMFSLGSLIGLLIGIQITKDEISEWFDVQIRNAKKLSKLDLIIGPVIFNVFVILTITLGIPFCVHSAESLANVDPTNLPEPFKTQLNNTIQISTGYFAIITPLVFNIPLGFYLGFRQLVWMLKPKSIEQQFESKVDN